VPAQVEATGWLLAGNAADAAERAAAHHERWKETGKPEATDAVSIPNWGRAEILENIARLLTDAYALQY
jgi:response regulator RpfG family c-di-GMP phosphodiesterase